MFDGQNLTNDDISREIAKMDLIDQQQLFKHVEIDSDNEGPRIPLSIRD